MRWDDAEPGDVGVGQALMSGLTILVCALVVGGILYWTMQLWFWLEDSL